MFNDLRIGTRESSSSCFIFYYMEHSVALFNYLGTFREQVSLVSVVSLLALREHASPVAVVSNFTYREHVSPAVVVSLFDLREQMSTV